MRPAWLWPRGEVGVGFGGWFEGLEGLLFEEASGGISMSESWTVGCVVFVTIRWARRTALRCGAGL